MRENNLGTLGVYANGNADPRVRGIAESIVGPGVVKINSRAQLKSLKRLPDELIVIGGEGSVWVVIQEMFRRKQIRPVGLLGGGTQNVRYGELKNSDRFMTIEEFRDTSVDKFPGTALFRPGQRGKIIFNNQISRGVYECANGTVNDTLRFVPKPLRPVIVRGYAGFIAMASNGQKIDMFSVVSHIGNVEAFPDQDPNGFDITHAWIEGKFSVLKLPLVLACWAFDLVPPKTLLQTDRQNKFENIDFHDKQIWLDGDTMKNPGRGRFDIVRANFPIPMVALIRAA